MDDSEIFELRARLAVATDALRRAEERAVAGQLALEVMHEVRNPLEALGNLLYLTGQSADDGNQVRAYVRLAEEQMRTLASVSNRTLGMARPGRGTQQMRLAELAEAALRIHQRAIESKRVKLKKRLPEDLVAEVRCSEMLQVISNFIVNALDAMPEEGTLQLRLRKSRDKVCLLIADNGHGIAKEHLTQIFEPFFTTKEEKGTGLGLSLSKDIVESHRGEIRVKSSIREGKSGTAFRISIPVEFIPSP